VLDADPRGERPRLATEFVDGPALDEQVARGGTLPRTGLEILGRGSPRRWPGCTRAGWRTRSSGWAAP
jgi:hypothetical protein